MGIGDWGLGIGDWGLGPILNSQFPILNSQFPKIKRTCHLKDEQMRFAVPPCLASPRATACGKRGFQVRLAALRLRLHLQSGFAGRS